MPSASGVSSAAAYKPDITAVSKSYKSVKQGLQELKRLQNKMRLRKQVKEAAKKTGKKIGNGFTGLIKQATKKAGNSAKAAIAGIIGYLLLMTAAGGMIFGFILTFIWNTKQIMDTTEISETINALDLKRQQKLYVGFDHFDIIRKNIDGLSTSHDPDHKYEYYYLFAEDVPLEEEDSYPTTYNERTPMHLSLTLKTNMEDMIE